MTARPPFPLYFKLRQATRQLGLNSLMARTLDIRNHRLRMAFLKEYQRERPATTDVRVGEHTSRMRVQHAQQFADLKMAREPRVVESLFRLVNPHDVIWDIGANMGFYTLPLARHVGPAGRILAFEPLPDIRAILEWNIVANHLLNVTVVPYALGNRRTKAALPLTAAALVGGHVIRPCDSNADTSDLPIRIEVADELFALGELPPPDLVKIDVEGAELDVLEGMESVLESANLRAVLIEVHFSLLAKRGVSNPEVSVPTVLESFGFTAQSWLDRSHLLAQRAERTCEVR